MSWLLLADRSLCQSRPFLRLATLDVLGENYKPINLVIIATIAYQESCLGLGGYGRSIMLLLLLLLFVSVRT